MLKLAVISENRDGGVVKALKKNYSLRLFNSKNYKEFVARFKKGEFKRVLYIIENRKDNRYIYNLAIKYRGVLILKDFFLPKIAPKDLDSLYYERGYSRKRHPLNRKILNSSKGVILFKNHYKRAFQDYYCIKGKKLTFLPNYQNIYRAIESFYKIKRGKLSDLNLDELLFATGESFRQKQILLDISSLVHLDLRTGIQRVVKKQLEYLIKLSPKNVRVEPIYLDRPLKEEHFFYARDFMKRFYNFNSNLKDNLINLEKGDIYYGVDLVKDVVKIASKRGIYSLFKRIGVEIAFKVYDLLPITYPQFFPKDDDKIHREWVENISKYGDKLISISKKVQNELESFLDKNKKGIRLKYIHLGADIKSFSSIKRKRFSKPTFLAVGTIEPRKGYRELLRAFEMLWSRGVDYRVVMVGREGWMMDDFLYKIKNHPERNRNLIYLNHPNDRTLQSYYLNSWALIYPSYDEGFGLPIIEASYYNLPLIVRDKEVFREIAGDNAYYFKDTKEPFDIYQAILNWMRLERQKSYPQSKNINYLSWRDSTKWLLEILNSKKIC